MLEKFKGETICSPQIEHAVPRLSKTFPKSTCQIDQKSNKVQGLDSLNKFQDYRNQT
jgi:hypothetical protein